MRIPKPPLRNSRLSAHATTAIFAASDFSEGMFGMLTDFRRFHMTTIQWHEPRVRHHEARQALSRAGNRVLATFREWRRRVHDRNQLGELDERMLKDIGITRSDAEFLMNKPFWRE
jgi:uncharacterized protein YjiS (DUF1127 family)